MNFQLEYKNTYDKSVLHFNRYKCLKYICFFCKKIHLVNNYSEIIKNEASNNYKKTMLCIKCKTDNVIPIVPKSHFYNMSEEDILNFK